MTMQYSIPKPINIKNRQWPDKQIKKSPTWCAVDLRDGNQALPNPMTPEQKKEYFKLLVKLGFKEIEIGFPSASADDFQFCRDLIEQNMIPSDVTISVLTQAREHLIHRTMEALQGIPKAVCHVYVATSNLHMQFVFGKTPEQTMTTIIDSIKLIKKLSNKMPDSNIELEFSPEEFTDSELEYTAQMCDNVVQAWQPKNNEKIIMNLPATVERRLPNQYADMIEQFCKIQKYRNKSIISVHAHNDMGCAVAATQMAIMAGAERVEGTLFGHGERSGNVDLITIIMNMQYLGIDTKIDFSDIETVRDQVAKLTTMPVHPRHPYAGELVFSAFAGSHQDAIHKGLTSREKLTKHFQGWKIPYLHVDPKQIGRTYEKFIRINSQSGKGGVAHVLATDYEVELPRNMLIDFSQKVQKYADQSAREIQAREIWHLFMDTYFQQDGRFKLIKYWPRPNTDDPSVIEGEVQCIFDKKEYNLKGIATGPIAAFVKAISTLPLPPFTLKDYAEDAIGSTADAEAIAYVRLENNKQQYYGVGFETNIDQAAIRALVSALNTILETK